MSSADDSSLLVPKLLAHRVRGFDDIEHTPRAFRRACRSRATYLEIDTRVSLDGEIVVHHDADLHISATHRRHLAEIPSDELREIRYDNDQPLLFLRDALRTFCDHARTGQHLCIDIKDFGFESQHIRLATEAELENRVCFVSWIPQTVLRLRELGYDGPIVLSYFDLSDLPWGFVLSKTAPRRPTQIGPGLVMLGRGAIATDLGSRAHGYRHFLVDVGLAPELRDAISGGRGAICVPRQLAGVRIAQFCRDNDIDLWVFSVRGQTQFGVFADDPAIDVIFSDDANVFDGPFDLE